MTKVTSATEYKNVHSNTYVESNGHSLPEPLDIHNDSLVERLQKAVLSVNSSLEIKEVLELILDQLGYVFPYESGSIQFLEEDTMRILAVRNQSAEIVGRCYDLETHLFNRQLAEGKPVIVSNGDKSQYGWKMYDEENDIKSTLGVPLWIRDRVIGALTIDSSTDRSYTEEDVAIVQAFAQQAAIAIENARLFEEQRSQRELAQALAEAASVVGSTLDLEKVLDHILEQAARVVKGDIFNILMISGNRGEFVRWLGYNRYGMSDADIAKVKIPIYEYPKLVQMMEDGEPVLVKDIFQVPGWVQSNPYRKYMRSYVAAPIRIANKTEGFLNVNGTRPNQFNMDDAQRLLSFANHAAIAIQNANLFQQQRNYSEQLEKQVRLRTIQLEARNAWLQAILDSTTDGIVVTDSAGDIVQQNRIVDTWLNETLALDDIKKFYEIVRKIARQPEECKGVLLELTDMDLELNAAPISDQDTTRSVTVIAVHDVTYLKELDRMKSRFVSNVSHELRTPLTSIHLYANLIRKSNAENLTRYVDALTLETARLSNLVEDVLQISRIESGKLELRIQPTDLNILTETVVAGHLVLAESHNLNIVYHAHPSQTLVKIDRDKFAQVLNNLVENAINYTPEGGHIQVSIGQQMIGEQNWATVTIQDTGMGIPENELEYIFERFFRGEEPQKKQIQGSGLGLAIVKEILQLHGGDITVKSEVGLGSTFTVQIPLLGFGSDLS
jgi:signal transduction histidine kinase